MFIIDWLYIAFLSQARSQVTVMSSFQGTRTSVQVGPPESWLPRRAAVPQMTPIQLLDEVHRSLTEQLTFLDDVNADDAGRGIVEAQRRYILSASKGAIFILISTCYNSLTNVSDDIQVPVGAVNLGHYVRSNAGRTNLPLDSVVEMVMLRIFALSLSFLMWHATRLQIPCSMSLTISWR